MLLELSVLNGYLTPLPVNILCEIFCPGTRAGLPPDSTFSVKRVTSMMEIFFCIEATEKIERSRSSSRCAPKETPRKWLNFISFIFIYLIP